MQGFAIVKLEVDAAAAKENIVQHFNEYVQRTSRVPSFIHENEGYFRISYDGKIGISSAAINELGTFLQSSGYTISAIGSVASSEGEPATVVSFSDRNGTEAHVTVSTVNVY
jgi:hypothetical protein